MVKEKKQDIKEQNPALCKLKDEWQIFLWGFFRPLAIVPLIATGASLYFANREGVDKSASLILQIIATLFGAITAGAFYDAVKNIFETSTTIKKGLSAVRNLALARLKTENISNRSKENASDEEMRNLLSLLGKDIANAVQEWNDILPGVGRIEEVYNLLTERERDLDAIKKEKAQLGDQLAGEKELSNKEKEDLKGKLAAKNERITELEKEISNLRLKTNSFPVSGAGFAWGSTSPYYDYTAGLGGSTRICSKCGIAYVESYTAQNILGVHANICPACQMAL